MKLTKSGISGMDDNIQKKLEELFILYRNSLPEKIANIDLLWNEIVKQWDSSTFEVLHRKIHSLCGSAVIYGYPELGKKAREAELFLQSRLHATTLTEDEKTTISALIMNLKTAARLKSEGGT
jgi:hypothetical protein